MNRLLKILGIIFLLIILGVTTMFVYIGTSGASLDKTSNVAANKFAKAIVDNNWESSGFWQYTHPIFSQKTSKFEWDKLSINIAAKLGVLQSLDPCVGQAHINITLTQERQTSAHYVCRINYYSGPLELKLILVPADENGEWLLAGLNINSKALLQP